MKLLNFGSLNLDYVYAVSHMVKPGETLAALDRHTFCGGKGLNQSIALSKAGVTVFHAGMVGEDGDILIKAGKEAGVNMEYVKKIPGSSGHTVIQVDEDGQNCILLYRGANGEMTEEYIDWVLSHFEKGDILLLQNEINLLNDIIDKAYEAGFVIILNPSPYNSSLEVCDFHKVSLFLLNEVEGRQMTGEGEITRMLEKLKADYPKAKVLLTLGQEGSVYQYQEEQYWQKIYQVKTVDTTAAGDTFTGYFIASMMKGMSVQEGMDRAAKASAIAVSRKGAASSIPVQAEVV